MSPLWASMPVRFRLTGRKVLCRNALCPRKVLAERLYEVARRYVRRTQRQREALVEIECAMGVVWDDLSGPAASQSGGPATRSRGGIGGAVALAPLGCRDHRPDRGDTAKATTAEVEVCQAEVEATYPGGLIITWPDTIEIKPLLG